MNRKKNARTAWETMWIISCIAVLCTVFAEAPELWNGVVTGKYFWFFWAQTAFSGFTLVNLFLKKRNCSISVLDISVLLFIAYCAINYLVQEGGFEIKLYLLLFLGMFYICLRILIQSVEAGKWILPMALVATGLAESVIGLGQLYGFSQSHHNLYRITGNFFNPGPFSGFVALTVPLAVYYAISFWKHAEGRMVEMNRTLGARDIIWAEKIKNIIWDRENVAVLLVGLSVLNIGAALLVIPAAMSRSAWLGIVAGILVVGAVRPGLFLKIKRFLQENKRRATLLLFVTAAVVVIAFAGIYLLKRGSADGRLFLWKISAEAMAQNPVFGVGLGNFAGAYGQAQYDYFVRGIDPQEAMTADCPVYAFNEFIQIGVEQGVVGLLLLLGIIVIAVRCCLREKEKEGILSAIVAVLVFAFTSYPFSILPICIAFTMLLALVSDGGKAMNNNALILLSAFVFTISLYSIGEERKLYRDYKKCSTLKLNIDSKYIDITEEYKSLYPYFKQYHEINFDYGQTLLKKKRYRESNDILLDGAGLSSDPMFYNLIGNNYLAMGRPDKAEQYYFRAYYTLPNRLYPLYLLARMYRETGQNEKAKVIARELLEKEPKVMSTAVKEMKDYAREILSD